MRRRKTTGCSVVGEESKSVVPYILSPVVNRAVDKLPVDLLFPGYRFCRPGTKLDEILPRGERGINELNEACLQNDIAYAGYKDNERGRIADQILANNACGEVKVSNSSVSERTYASAVDIAMKTKQRYVADHAEVVVVLIVVRKKLDRSRKQEGEVRE